jgi:hypothetical protein
MCIDIVFWLPNNKDLSEFTAETGISSYRIYNAFEGGWREACELAGFDSNYQNIPIDDDALFEEMRRVFLSYGNICNKIQFHRLSKYSSIYINNLVITSYGFGVFCLVIECVSLLEPLVGFSGF